MYLFGRNHRGHAGLKPVTPNRGTYQPLAFKDSKHMMTAGMVMFGGGIAGVLNDAVGPQSGGPDRHVLGE